jgi:hypothetical protein
MNTHHYAQTIQKVMQGAEPHMGAEWSSILRRRATSVRATTTGLRSSRLRLWRSTTSADAPRCFTS